LGVATAGVITCGAYTVKARSTAIIMPTGGMQAASFHQNHGAIAISANHHAKVSKDRTFEMPKSTLSSMVGCLVAASIIFGAESSLVGCLAELSVFLVGVVASGPCREP
jgi:hypothetical protein